MVKSIEYHSHSEMQEMSLDELHKNVEEYIKMAVTYFSYACKDKENHIESFKWKFVENIYCKIGIEIQLQDE